MKYIAFEPHSLSVVVTNRKRKGLVNIKASDWSGERVRHPISDRILFDVLYPAVYARDKGKKRNVFYKLAPPDPWLVSLGLIMWEGILQGLAWDAMKLMVRRALLTMSAKGVAPSARTRTIKTRSKTELGFEWTEYRSGRKQRQMFFGLRRSYENGNTRKRR